jgi:glycine/D-amino acid oxidase-like deaminating enzyme
VTGASRTSDVVVIGAGVIGCSVALHLRWRGLSVRLLEREVPGAGTSSRGFGLVWAQSKAPNTYLELTLASVDAYPQFLDALGDDCGYRRPGGIMPMLSQLHLEETRTLMDAQRRTPGFEVTFLDGQQARDLEPALADDLIGATWSPHDGHLEPKRLVAALNRALRAAGVEIVTEAPVASFQRSGGDWLITTQSEAFSTGTIVNCAGVWASELSRLVDVPLPIEVVRGQILTTPPQPPLLKHPTVDIRQATDGRIWMGTINQPDDWSLDVRAADTHTIRQLAGRQVPTVRDMPLENVWAGLRPIPRDGHPVLGEVATQPGYYVAVTHSGYSLCPIVGALVAEAIDTGSIPKLMAPFTLARFGAREPA